MDQCSNCAERKGFGSETSDEVVGLDEGSRKIVSEQARAGVQRDGRTDIRSGREEVDGNDVRGEGSARSGSANNNRFSQATGGG